MFFQTKSGIGRLNRPWRILLLATLLGGFSVPAQAEFMVASGQSQLADNTLNTTARLNLKITGDPAQALTKGIGLTIVIKTRLYRASLASWFFKVATWEDRYRVEHHALSNLYTLTHTNTGMTEEFPTLAETLDAMERYAITVQLPSGINKHDTLQIRLQVTLDRNDLPGPLKLVALISRQWQLRSSWGRWKVSTR